MQTEGRHILFFVNWYARYWRNLPWWKRPRFFRCVAAIWIKLIRDRISIARGLGPDGVAHDANFPANAAATMGDSLKPREPFELCLAENEQHMAGYVPRLLRPKFVPRMARLALKLMRE
ncbi:Hypothetical protein bglu_2g04740 [Burkholderia glumae BGR1]|uniref:Uncharacterized protein n=1 Tax=Burkholderia glumae TaxID=337 RepID=A0AAP9XZT0_BURGL|nr:Hypothetical protein bglu_2g04740 [Burkholderia glumae BGR1]AJY64231.1 hypothetical protein KS03_5443 [Burkholderia glumae LMG 2196 = ATCC 33617]KHJ59922.1 hypothetical protein NCPPB3923_26790 [Burkholderia glumae]NVE24060.1 hypothetical protein [Burkholderia glumae]PNL04740.1 hypothetical protein CEQ24_001910 [Burkholderia glumae]